MYKYRSIIENPEKLRSMTGLTTEEFHALVPIFHTAFEAYMRLHQGLMVYYFHTN